MPLNTPDKTRTLSIHAFPVSLHSFQTSCRRDQQPLGRPPAPAQLGDLMPPQSSPRCESLGVRSPNMYTLAPRGSAGSRARLPHGYPAGRSLGTIPRGYSKLAHIISCLLITDTARTNGVPTGSQERTTAADNGTGRRARKGTRLLRNSLRSAYLRVQTRTVEAAYVRDYNVKNR